MGEVILGEVGWRVVAAGQNGTSVSDFVIHVLGQTPFTRTWLPILLLSTLFGLLLHRVQGRKLGVLLPKDWVSVRTDVMLLMTGNAALFVRPLLVPAATLGAVVGWFGDPSGAAPGLWAWAVFGVLHFGFSEFVYWLLHWARHRFDALWVFHAIHHSADYLNPLTGFRRHPVEIALLSLCLDLPNYLPYGLLVWLYPGVPPESVLLFVVARALFVATYANLLHSHVWMSFGPLGERILLSPAMHQIHHSVKEGEAMSNYGQILSVFDAWFGTAVYAHEVNPEELVVGVEGLKHTTVFDIFVRPLMDFVQVARGGTWTALGVDSDRRS